MRAKSEEVQRWLKQLTLTEYLKIYLFDRDRPLGTYFDYVGYMWRAAKYNPNSLIVYYEDVVRVSTQALTTNADTIIIKHIPTLSRDTAVGATLRLIHENDPTTELDTRESNLTYLSE